MMFFKSCGLDQTMELGRKIAAVLCGNEVIAYYGGLGVGKTTLTAAIAEALASKEYASSPTFAIVNEYHGKYTIYHFDMYRIESWDDLYSTGFFDYLDTGIVIVEWSENIENALPENTIRITISKGDNESERIFEIEGIEI